MRCEKALSIGVIFLGIKSDGDTYGGIYNQLLLVTRAYPGAARPTLGPAYQFHWDIIRGMHQALGDAGLNPDGALRIVLDVSGSEVEGEIRTGLRDGYRGVFCLGDFRAPKAQNATF